MPRLLPNSGTVASPTPVDTASPSTAGASSHATTEAVSTDVTSLAGNGVENTLTRNSTLAHNSSSDSEDSSSDDSSSPNELIDGKSDAETYYQSKNSSLLALVTMCYGMKDDEDKPILDVDASPWKDIPRTSIKPKLEHYKYEIIRRHNHGVRLQRGRKSSVPRPKNWNVLKCQEWLTENPITTTADKEFLIDTVSIRKDTLEASAVEIATNDAKLGGGGNWMGKLPYLRLIHAIIDNPEIKHAFIHRAKLPPGRMSIEQRKHTVSVFAMIAEKWNDTDFDAITEDHTSVHSDFTSCIISHEDVADLAPATPEKVEDKWASVKNELTRVIANWERSGQGDGGIDDVDNGEDDVRSDGTFKDRSQHAMDSRANFFDNRNSYLLYIWIMLEKYQLLASTLQRLDDSIAGRDGTTSGLPSICNQDDDDDNLSSATSKFDSEMTVLKSSIENHGKSIVRAAQIDARQRNSEQLRGVVLTLDAEKRALEKEKRPLESEKRGIRIQKALVKENPELVTIYDEQIKEIDSQIALIDSQIADVASKIDFHSSLLCDATTDAQETPMRSNKMPRRIFNSPSEERGYSTS